MRDDVRLHAALIGQQGSRARLNTPALVIDLDALEHNIAAMAAFAAARGIGLRPHAKTHKSHQIARMQIEAGAIGICCAKLGEAEAIAELGGCRQHTDHIAGRDGSGDRAACCAPSGAPRAAGGCGSRSQCCGS